MKVQTINARFSLAWALDPIPVTTFLDDIWAREHHHVTRNCPAYFDALLPGPSPVDDLLELFRHAPAAMRMARGMDKKSSENYRLPDDSVDLDAIRDDFAQGYTIVLDGVEQYVRSIGTLARSIEVDLNFPVQVNAYITPPGQTGLAPHYDDHDVLILQIRGTKTWHLFCGADRLPHEIQREGDKAVAVEDLSAPTDVHVRAGDLLYVPRGRVHSAETDVELSVHLTVGIHAPTVLMLAIGALYAESFRDDRLNARLPARHLDDPQCAAALRGLLREAVAVADNSSAMTGGLDLLADGLVRRGMCPPVGKIADAKAIDVHTRVVKYAPLFAQVRRVDGGVTLQFATLSVNVAPDHDAALQFVCGSTDSFRVGDLPGLLPAQQVDLVRTLIVSGFLVRLPDVEAGGRDG